MKKESEIKILEEIHNLLFKLNQSRDTYWGEFVRPFFDLEDINLMMNNIKSDFPLLLHTKILNSLERTYDIYKKRLVVSHWRAARLKDDLKSAQLFIADQGETVGSLSKFRENIVELYALVSGDIIDRHDLMDRLKSKFTQDEIIMAKVNMDVPLTHPEKIHLKYIMKNINQTQFDTDESTKSKE